MLDETRRRSVRDAERTSARPMPKVVNVAELVFAVAVIVVVAVVIWIF
jgi:hypothetical protein